MTERRCPYCNYLVDAATPIDKQPIAPEPGDYLLCISCGEFSIETDMMTIRKPTFDEAEAIELDNDCQRARWAWARSVGIIRQAH